MARPVLYSFRRCPYAMRARLALEAGGVEVELREVIFSDKAPELLAASPKATVPVMVLDDCGVLEESLDIMRWTMKASAAGVILAPDQGDTGNAIALIERMDADFKPQLNHYKYPNRYEDIDAVEAREGAAEFIKELNGMLKNKPYLYGQNRSIADIGVAPFVRQFADVDRDWFYAQPWENVSVWLTEFTASPAFKRIMKKYPKWEDGDEVTVFPPEVW